MLVLKLQGMMVFTIAGILFTMLWMLTLLRSRRFTIGRLRRNAYNRTEVVLHKPDGYLFMGCHVINYMYNDKVIKVKDLHLEDLR